MFANIYCVYDQTQIHTFHAVCVVGGNGWGGEISKRLRRKSLVE